MKLKLRHFRWIHRRGFSRSKLQDTWLHRLLGERLFEKELWTFQRETVARGWFLGCLVGTTPFLGTHLLMGIPLAILTRSNLLVVLALIFATNPVTIGIFYPFAFWLGCLVTAHSAGEYQWTNLSVWHAGVPLCVGCTLIGGFTGLIGWLAIRWPRQVNPSAQTAGGKSNLNPLVIISQCRNYLNQVRTPFSIGFFILGLVYLIPLVGQESIPMVFQAAKGSAWNRYCEWNATWASLKIILSCLALFSIFNALGCGLIRLKMNSLANYVYYSILAPCLGFFMGGFFLLKALF